MGSRSPAEGRCRARNKQDGRVEEAEVRTAIHRHKQLKNMDEGSGKMRTCKDAFLSR